MLNLSVAVNSTNETLPLNMILFIIQRLDSNLTLSLQPRIQDLRAWITL